VGVSLTPVPLSRVGHPHPEPEDCCLSSVTINAFLSKHVTPDCFFANSVSNWSISVCLTMWRLSGPDPCQQYEVLTLDHPRFVDFHKSLPVLVVEWSKEGVKFLDGTAIPAIPTTDLYTYLRSQNYFGDMLQRKDHYSYTTMSPTFQMRACASAGTL
jgi:hypothetical protein